MEGVAPLNESKEQGKEQEDIQITMTITEALESLNVSDTNMMLVIR